MRKTFFKIHTFSWAIAILVMCLTFTVVVRAETEKHHDSHKQEVTVKEEKGHEEDHESHEHRKTTDIDSHDEHEEEGHEEGNRKVGENKAVVEIHDKKGFRLSPQAYEALGIKHQKVTSPSFVIPKSALVRIKNTTGIYRFKDHFFKLIPVKILSEKQNQYVVMASIKADELVITKGIELLRVADIYVQDTSDYSHGH